MSSVVSHLVAIITGIKYLFLSKRMTIRYPEQVTKPKPGYRGMIKLNINKCIHCGLCAKVCPASAMKMISVKKKQTPVIDYQRCIFCGFCVDICPVNALENTWVHDVAKEKMKDLILFPEDFAKDRVSPAELEGAKKAKVIFDEKAGLKYVTD